MGEVAEIGLIDWKFENSYAQLPDVFFAPAQPATVRDPRLSLVNERMANELGLDFAVISRESLASLFAGQTLPEGARPIAQAYAGHQFGNFTMLGDGRAILLGEHRTPDGQLVDIQLKGAGQTMFSRRGDGRAALGPMLREYIISEAMAALGIPTTRSLAVVTTGERVYRANRLPGAVLTRVAASHLRVGTFEYAAARQDESHLRVLADYAIQRHYPELIGGADKYLQFLDAVIERQASLIARWQHVGFIHGVMNTDNMAISGETIDYGPCAFMNAYRADTVFSSIDHAGRYSYGNQPAIAQWNLARFAEALLPLLNPDQELAVQMATEALGRFRMLFEQFWLVGMRKKLGLQTAETEDVDLVQALLSWMEDSRADFTRTFRDLSNGEVLAGGDYQDPAFMVWNSRWQQRLEREGQFAMSVSVSMKSVNPAIIPRNHRVEEALAAAENQEDLSGVHRLLQALEKPFEPDSDALPYQEPPVDDAGYQTFCGT